MGVFLAAALLRCARARQPHGGSLRRLRGALSTCPTRRRAAGFDPPPVGYVAAAANCRAKPPDRVHCRVLQCSRPRVRKHLRIFRLQPPPQCMHDGRAHSPYPVNPLPSVRRTNTPCKTLRRGGTCILYYVKDCFKIYIDSERHRFPPHNNGEHCFGSHAQ